MDLERTFDAAARARVAQAVREAEAGSRGQIVPVLVAKSDHYPEARFRGALLGAALATGAVLLLGAPLTLAELPAVQLAGGALGMLLALAGPVERRLVGRKALDQAVHARALRAFHEHGLQRTAEGTGVLLFASLLERRAVVLGDHGIHARVGEGEWKETVEVLVAGLRRGSPADGLTGAIARCGARLAEHFPRAPGAAQPNELPDDLEVSPR